MGERAETRVARSHAHPAPLPLSPPRAHSPSGFAPSIGLLHQSWIASLTVFGFQPASAAVALSILRPEARGRSAVCPALDVVTCVCAGQTR